MPGETKIGDVSTHGERAEGSAVKVVDRRWWARSGADQAGTEESSTTKPSYVQELERQLAEKNDLLQSYMSKYREASTEFEQAKTRIRRDTSKEVERGRRTLIVDLLEVVDNLDRAVGVARESPSPEKLLEGIEMVRTQFLGKLQALGIARVEALGQKFDPTRHEAVAVVPARAPEQDGTVVGVVREGYAIGDEVLRPAAVAVAKAEQ